MLMIDERLKIIVTEIKIYTYEVSHRDSKINGMTVAKGWRLSLITWEKLGEGNSLARALSGLIALKRSQRAPRNKLHSWKHSVQTKESKVSLWPNHIWILYASWHDEILTNINGRC